MAYATFQTASPKTVRKVTIEIQQSLRTAYNAKHGASIPTNDIADIDVILELFRRVNKSIKPFAYTCGKTAGTIAYGVQYTLLATYSDSVQAFFLDTDSRTGLQAETYLMKGDRHRIAFHDAPEVRSDSSTYFPASPEAFRASVKHEILNQGKYDGTIADLYKYLPVLCSLLGDTTTIPALNRQLARR